MPTGYTADVADGSVTDFRTFALRCARAFGAAIMQRDDPMDVPPKPREVSSYHADELAKAEARMAELDAMSIEERKAAALAANERQAAHHAEIVADYAARKVRYETMLGAVRAWQPPTSAHEALRRFMVQQLEESIRFDCGDAWEPPAPRTWEHWASDAWAAAASDANYHTKKLAEERAAVAEANAWIAALYASLQPTEGA